MIIHRQPGQRISPERAVVALTYVPRVFSKQEHSATAPTISFAQKGWLAARVRSDAGLQFPLSALRAVINPGIRQVMVLGVAAEQRDKFVF